ncbi:hypothetical protein HG537_0E02820 [Torulaspora globosa]|uniref:Large ribosomal subunit protein mL38 n=1 Tax=Torulaspora globosa TaxID=48254 RepID=A0A7H9HVY7_9SACH|nr:hypothetical protein HG537_0E02820 [Torulaspora sp. CBS 2947]
MLTRCIHTWRTVGQAKVWSSLAENSRSLRIRSESVRKCILEGTSPGGPPSLKRRFNRLKYNSPEKIDETFQICYDFLKSRANQVDGQVSKAEDPKETERLLVKAELDNPEVQYNFQYNDKVDNDPDVIDYEQPVYRYLGKKHWEEGAQMLLMQRLESLAIIPDTLPTLVPRAEVSLKFPFSTGVNKWIEPGELLSSNTTSLPPAIKIQEYELLDPKNQYYTILVVNPDEPDLENDSFRTTLNYGLVNVQVSYNDNVVDARKCDATNVISTYLPPVPEKNAGTQRFAVWLFRQPSALQPQRWVLNRDNFDIRQFARDHSLLPVGAHVWRSEWDSNVPHLRASHGLPPGRIFTRTRS